jgi:L-fuconolactonase
MPIAASPAETILEPDLPIIDPHHHLWHRPAGAAAPPAAPQHSFTEVVQRVPRYLLDELLADFNSGHNIRASVFVLSRARDNTNYLQQIFMSSTPSKGVAFQA